MHPTAEQEWSPNNQNKHYTTRTVAQLSSEFQQTLLNALYLSIIINTSNSRDCKYGKFIFSNVTKCAPYSFNVLVFARQSQQTFSRSRYDCFIDKSLLALSWLLMMIVMMMTTMLVLAMSSTFYKGLDVAMMIMEMKNLYLYLYLLSYDDNSCFKVILHQG